MEDMRNQILSELIDKMHGRLADKMYPDNEGLPPAADAPKEEEDAAPVEMEIKEKPAEDDDDISDSDIEEILKSC